MPVQVSEGQGLCAEPPDAQPELVSADTPASTMNRATEPRATLRVITRLGYTARRARVSAQQIVAFLLEMPQ
jgi:hypothetical protein